jgi:hypothetical protein
MAMLNTVKENKEVFTDREYHRSKEVQRALVLVGYPSPRDFKNMVRANMIKNCTVTNYNINNDDKLFGPDLESLKGEIVRLTPDPIMTEYVTIPK